MNTSDTFGQHKVGGDSAGVEWYSNVECCIESTDVTLDNCYVVCARAGNTIHSSAYWLLLVFYQNHLDTNAVTYCFNQRGKRLKVVTFIYHHLHEHEQQRFTMRSGVLTGNVTGGAAQVAAAYCPNERTLDPAFCSQTDPTMAFTPQCSPAMTHILF